MLKRLKAQRCNDCQNLELVAIAYAFIWWLTVWRDTGLSPWVLSHWKQVLLKMLDFSDKMTTGISILTSAADKQNFTKQLPCQICHFKKTSHCIQLLYILLFLLAEDAISPRWNRLFDAIVFYFIMFGASSQCLLFRFRFLQWQLHCIFFYFAC